MSKDTISVNMNVYDIPILVEQLEKANKEIKILKEEYVMLQNASDEVEEEKDKEIERLTENNLSMQGEMARTWKKAEEKDKEIERLNSIIKEVREKVDSFDVFKEFTFPLMKRDVENQVKSSIDYEWRKTIKEPILEILDKENNNEDNNKSINP